MILLVFTISEGRKIITNSSEITWKRDESPYAYSGHSPVLVADIEEL